LNGILLSSVTDCQSKQIITDLKLNKQINDVSLYTLKELHICHVDIKNTKCQF